MNFSHGSYEYHQSVIDNTRKMIAGVWLLSLRVIDGGDFSLSVLGFR